MDRGYRYRMRSFRSARLDTDHLCWPQAESRDHCRLKVVLDASDRSTD